MMTIQEFLGLERPLGEPLFRMATGGAHGGYWGTQPTAERGVVRGLLIHAYPLMAA